MDKESLYVLMGVKTNRGNLYTIRVDLDKFPEKSPKAFVRRMLKDRHGRDLDKRSYKMHTYDSRNGYTHISHISSENWHSKMSLTKVYVMCRLWLEMYELHLFTRNDIDYYLHHAN